MKPSNLYSLQADYLRLLDKDSYSHEDMQALDELPGLIEDKLIQRGYVIRNLEYLIASINCELTNMTDRRNKLQKNLDILQESCINAMQIANIAKIDKCPSFQIALHKKKMRVDIYDIESLPSSYKVEKETITECIDKNRIHIDISAGKDVPGARLVDPVKLVIK